jgi:hypothetical protein
MDPSDVVNAGMAIQTEGRLRPLIYGWLVGWDRPNLHSHCAVSIRVNTWLAC